MRKKANLIALIGRVGGSYQGFRKLKTDDMSIAEYHKHLDTISNRDSQERLRDNKALVDAVDVDKLPGSEEMSTYISIREYFDRNHSLPGSYRDWLKKLAKGMCMDEIIPLEARAMAGLGLGRKF